MRESRIILNKRGYEPILDFLKGLGIIMVVISHGTLRSIRNWLIFPIWIDQAVPIFLLIQTFHAYKHQIVRYPTVIKLWKRIILPFFIIQMLLIIYYYVHSIHKESDFIVSMLNLLASGGKGQGSYYIWVYIQMAITLPLFQHLVRRRCAFVFYRVEHCF